MSTQEDINKKFEELRKTRESMKKGLYTGKTDAELLELAKELVEADDPDLQITFLTDTKEKKKARELTRRYIKEYFIETYGDKQLVKHLVYLEVIQGRLQDQLNDIHKQESKVPIQMLDILQKNLKAIVEARAALGLNRDKQKSEAGSEGIQALQKLKAKFKKHIEETHQASRTIKCPHCSEMVLLVIRTEAYEAKKHPYFKDRILGNDHLISLYLSKHLTQEDVAKILGTSPEYTQWLADKWQNKSNVGNQD